jgi:hypothetical protein
MLKLNNEIMTTLTLKLLHLKIIIQLRIHNIVPKFEN